MPPTPVAAPSFVDPYDGAATGVGGIDERRVIMALNPERDVPRRIVALAPVSLVFAATSVVAVAVVTGG
jgi:hypothetical protein